MKCFSLQLDLIYMSIGGEGGIICLTLKQLVDGEKASYCELFALLMRKCPVLISLQHSSLQASISSQSSCQTLAVAPPTYT